jgi:hypothetical protein
MEKVTVTAKPSAILHSRFWEQMHHSAIFGVRFGENNLFLEPDRQLRPGHAPASTSE